MGNKLPDFIKQGVNNGREDGKSLSVAYVNKNGQPVLSLRGSTQVYSDHQLSIWLRKAEGGMAEALQTHPKIALLYRDHDTRTTYTFEGEGRVVDGSDRERVWQVTPESERGHDLDRHGAAVIIDVTRFRAMYANMPGIEKRQPIDMAISGD